MERRRDSARKTQAIWNLVARIKKSLPRSKDKNPKKQKICSRFCLANKEDAKTTLRICGHAQKISSVTRSRTQRASAELIFSFSFSLVPYNLRDKVKNIKNNANLCKSIVCGAAAIRIVICEAFFVCLRDKSVCETLAKVRVAMKAKKKRLLTMEDGCECDSLMNNSIRRICTTNANRLLNGMKKLLSQLFDGRKKNYNSFGALWKDCRSILNGMTQ